MQFEYSTKTCSIDENGQPLKTMVDSAKKVEPFKWNADAFAFQPVVQANEIPASDASFPTSDQRQPFLWNVTLIDPTRRCAPLFVPINYGNRLESKQVTLENGQVRKEFRMWSGYPTALMVPNQINNPTVEMPPTDGRIPSEAACEGIRKSLMRTKVARPPPSNHRKN